VNGPAPAGPVPSGLGSAGAITAGAPSGSARAGRTDRAWLPGRLRGLAPWVLIAVGVVALGVIAAPSGQGAPLDPNGTGPQGARAFVLLLRQYGADVSLVEGVPGAGTRTAVVLTDQLDASRRTAVDAWVRGGGTLVVADPRSPLQVGVPTRVGNGFTSTDLHPQGPCPALGLLDVSRLSVGPSLVLRSPGAALTRCYGYDLRDGEEADFLLGGDAGRGRVIGLGGAGLWTNQRLGQEDNAALAVGLLAPPGGGRVAVLMPSKVGSGTRSAVGLLGPHVRSALIELLVAFGVLAWWRGRRLGRPVPESMPVPVAGSELVNAVGGLLARTRNRDAAARQLRDGARRWLGERVGVGSTAPAPRIAEAVATRLGTDPERVLGLLADDPVADDDALVRLAQSLARLRQEVTGGNRC